jgi:DnaJ-class molecular chaperone
MPVTDVDPTVDYYRHLGVSSSAGADEVKRAYRMIAKDCHPDSTGGDVAKTERFKLASVAYGVVGDPDKRAQYDAARDLLAREQEDRDRRRSTATGSTGTRAGAGSGDRSSRYMNTDVGDHGKPFDLGSLVDDLMGGGLMDDLSEIARDVAKSVSIGTGGPRPARHADHAGPTTGGPARGGAPGGSSATEGSETGTAWAGGAKRRRPARPRPARTVPACDGSPLDVDGRDVHSRVRISLLDAIRGTKISVATISGVVDVRVTPGSAGGSRLRLRGRGIPGAMRANREQEEAGDHHVTLVVAVPRAGEEAEVELSAILRELR